MLLPGLTRSVAFAAALLLSPGLATGQGVVHVVDVNGGPGTDFTSVSAALAVAVAGDTVLVRAGDYDEFPTVRRGVTLTADLGATVNLTDLSVQSLPAGEVATLRGLTITEGPGVSPGTLRIRLCEGTVWVEDCDVLCAPVPFQSGGVFIDRCDEVVLSRCYIEPPDESLATLTFPLWCDESNVFLYDIELRGRTIGEGQDGVAAASVQDSYLAVSGGSMVGGNGSDGFLFFCDGGDGGDGLQMYGASTEVLLLGTMVMGGRGGKALQAGCNDGADGQPINVQGGTYVQHTSTAPRQLQATSPTREGQTLTVTLDNLAARPQTGDFLWVMASALPGSGVADASNLFGGLLAVAPPRIFYRLGPTGGQNLITLGTVVPDLGPGVEASEVYLQGLLWDASAGVLVPSTPSAALLLDSSF